MTAAQVESALLTTEELPSGWRKDRSFPEDDNAGTYEFQIAVADKPDCQPALDTVVGSDEAPKAENVAVRVFTKGPDGPELMTGVAAYLPDEAKEMVDGAALPTGCERFTAEDPDLGKLKVRFQRLQLPDLGDATVGTRVRLIPTDKDFLSVQLDNAVVRVDGAIVTVSMFSYNRTDRGAFDQAVRAAVDKVTGTGGTGSSPA